MAGCIKKPLVCAVTISFLILSSPLFGAYSQSSLSALSGCRSTGCAGLFSRVRTGLLAPPSTIPSFTPSILPSIAGLATASLFLTPTTIGTATLNQNEIDDLKRAIAPSGSRYVFAFDVAVPTNDGIQRRTGTSSTLTPFILPNGGCQIENDLFGANEFYVVGVVGGVRQFILSGGVSANQNASGSCIPMYESLTQTGIFDRTSDGDALTRFNSLSRSAQQDLVNNLTDSQIENAINQERDPPIIPRFDIPYVPFGTDIITDTRGRTRFTPDAFVNGEFVRGIVGTPNFANTQDRTLEEITGGRLKDDPVDRALPQIPDIGNLNPPNITQIQPKVFTGINFLSYAMTRFSTKFPFDILSVPPISEQLVNDCPTYSFFDKPFELCPIRDLFIAIQVPILISYIIWSVMSL